ncbi:group II intron reverse transcriptase/maturase [Streptomyces sp. NBC_01618]|uniref:group II intron reverse transcriptase/maturase n=1 Tax=Streptomyces sp. NBC_01618 TaxID=2975900 RepID=UPI00386AA394|nr:group II intron reverse transcriptase/maturase [Streptomyces sp. NBC_01618]
MHNLVCDPAFLVAAWERVSTNKGAQTPGIDRATASRIESWVGVEAFLEQIRDSLKSDEFRPVEVRQVMIPKANGKLRSLGIPTMKDRVIQASLKLVLEPIFEADFKPCSYGFRPNRRAQDAVAEIHYLASETRNYHWVFEADIKACFDEIDHTVLMDRLRVRIKDKRVCALVKAFLKSGVLTELGSREETLTGTPQGGILSPLLANIALSALDENFIQQWQIEMGNPAQRRKRRRKGIGNWRLLRYCDDFVLMVSGNQQHAEVLREQVAAVPAPLGLRLAPEKTRVVHIDEGFTFLGFDIRRMRKRGTSKYYVYTTPSKKAIASIKDKVKAKPYRSTLHMDLDELITSLNRSLAGWANYFRYGVSKATFGAIDSFTWRSLMRWTRVKYAGRTGLSMKQLRRRFCDKGWRFTYNGASFTGTSSVAVTRYRYRGSNIPTPWTPKPTVASTGG